MSNQTDNGVDHVARKPDFLISALSYLDEVYVSKESNPSIDLTRATNTVQKYFVHAE